MKLFGRNLKQLRTTRGFTQEYLAEETKTSQTQIARMEAGRLNTSISNLYFLARALDCSFDDFFKK